MFKCFISALILFITTSAFAKPIEKNTNRQPASETLVVRDCDSRTPTSLEYFVEKKSYANETIQVFSVDTYGEPACCSSHLVIYMPHKDLPMTSKCFHISSNSEGLGFNGVNMSRVRSSYNARTGVTLALPALFYNPETGGANQKSFSIVINQAEQSVRIK